MRWLDAMHRLLGTHVAAVRNGWAGRTPGTVHDLVDGIVTTERAGTWPGPVQEAADATRAAIAATPQWQHLVTALGIGAREVEWLALLAGCELNPRLARVLGYLD